MFKADSLVVASKQNNSLKWQLISPEKARAAIYSTGD
jgi:hypothetical protein